MTTKKTQDEAPITIKKYANRRLYNTATSSYVTLDHLSQMVKDGVDFAVYDAKSGEDITRSVLTQIIVEEESKGQNLLPTSFLRHLISFYGDSLQGLVPRYLDHSMQSFTHNQDNIRQYMKDTMGGLFPFNQFEEMGKQNMAFFENAMKMLAPFQPGIPGMGGTTADSSEKPSKPASEETSSNLGSAKSKAEAIDDIKSKLEEMQRQLASLSGADGKKND